MMDATSSGDSNNLNPREGITAKLDRRFHLWSQHGWGRRQAPPLQLVLVMVASGRTRRGGACPRPMTSIPAILVRRIIIPFHHPRCGRTTVAGGGKRRPYRWFLAMIAAGRMGRGGACPRPMTLIVVQSLKMIVLEQRCLKVQAELFDVAIKSAAMDC